MILINSLLISDRVQWIEMSTPSKLMRNFLNLQTRNCAFELFHLQLLEFNCFCFFFFVVVVDFQMLQFLFSTFCFIVFYVVKILRAFDSYRFLLATCSRTKGKYFYGFFTLFEGKTGKNSDAVSREVYEYSLNVEFLINQTRDFLFFHFHWAGRRCSVSKQRTKNSSILIAQTLE